ncbi:hypothetical protein BU17DRAFT_87680 [Hysterangium stoloniferum]|nr:hypothetical protein BU17DRAFT_87680 [Hysterangium stoloniferum]
MDRESQILSSSSTVNSTSPPQFGLSESASAENSMWVAWVVFQLAGQVSLPILVITLFLSKRIARRNPTVINLCIVWALATIPPLLLFYAGQYQGPQPDQMLCMLQAATLSAVGPMAAMAYFSVVVHASAVTYEILSDTRARAFTLNLRLVFFLGSPYVTFFAFAFWVAYIGSKHPSDVVRYQFYCIVANHHLSTPVFTFTSVVVFLTLICQLWICVICYRDYSNKRKLDSSSTRSVGSGFRSALTSFNLPFLARMIAFTLFEILIVVASVETIFDPQQTVTEVLLATPPFAVFLTFATSQDILCVWFPCISRNTNTSFTQIRETQDLLRDERYSHRSGPSVSRTATISQYSFGTLESDARPVSSVRYSIEKSPSSDMGVEDIEKGITAPIPVYTPPQRHWQSDDPNAALIAREFGGSGTVVHSTNPRAEVSPLDILRGLEGRPHLPVIKKQTSPRRA